MPDRDLIAEAQKEHSLHSPRCHGVMELPAPVRMVLACAVCGFEDWDELPTQDRTAELEAERIADEFGIKSLSVEDGVPILAIEPTTEQARELVLAMSLACGRMLDEDQAPNYVEFEVSPANQLGYIVHVRRAGGPSPHTLRREAEDRAEQAEARIAELEGPPVGHVVALFAEGHEPVIYGSQRVMSVANAIRSVGRSDLPRGVTLKLCELREVNDDV